MTYTKLLLSKGFKSHYLSHIQYLQSEYHKLHSHEPVEWVEVHWRRLSVNSKYIMHLVLLNNIWHHFNISFVTLQCITLLYTLHLTIYKCWSVWGEMDQKCHLKKTTVDQDWTLESIMVFEGWHASATHHTGQHLFSCTESLIIY